MIDIKKTPSNFANACIHDINFVLCVFRLLGTVSVPLQEAVSRGSQSLSSALKSKKGDIMQVSTSMRNRVCTCTSCVIGQCF